MAPPSKYTPDMCDTLISMMRTGASIGEVSTTLGIGRTTVYNWRKPDGKYYNPDFAEALEMGLTYSEAWWLRQGRENLCKRSFNYQLWFTNMCNRFGWSNRAKKRGDTVTYFVRDTPQDWRRNYRA